MSAINVSTQAVATGALVVIAGELDMSTVPSLASCLDELDGEVTLDCRDLTFLDSTAIDLVAQTHHRLAGNGGRFVIANLPESCLRAIVVMDLDRVLELR